MTGPDGIRGLAAVDLGSNSFHMVIADLVGGEPVIVDRMRDQVQLAAGLDGDGTLSKEARERALACLRRFGQRLPRHDAFRVRAVGTNTLRRARNARQFLVAAEKALGRPVEIIEGREEARLIYLGVAHALSDDAGSRLVLDIGGGSTECILGERFEAYAAHSLDMGCVSFTQRFFADGAIRRSRFDEAVLMAQRELLVLERPFQEIGWDEAVGASGTIRAIDTILRETGWSHEGITAAGVERLGKELVAAGHADSLAWPGLKRERAGVLAGGTAILSAVFTSLRLDRMDVAGGALKEGVLYDLLGRIRHEDVRERTIRRFQERYDVDRGQAARVERTAVALLHQVAAPWSLSLTEHGPLLEWAARLHEIGLAVTYRHHHHHGGYLIAHSDMPGFGREDKRLLAALVAGHRRKPVLDGFEPMRRKAQRRLTLRLLTLLRLAVVLNRSRQPQALPPVTLEVDGARLVLSAPADWMASHPLTRADLEDEVRMLEALGQSLEIVASE